LLRVLQCVLQYVLLKDRHSHKSARYSIVVLS